MLRPLIALVLVFTCSGSLAQNPAATAKAFTLDQVIHPRVTKMRVPISRAEVVGIQMTVSSPSAKAREHVLQGFAMIHAQWDFEAYRHFCTALKKIRTVCLPTVVLPCRW